MDSTPSPFLEAIPRDLLEARQTVRATERTTWFQQPWKYVPPDFRTRRDRLYGGAPLRTEAEPADPSYQVDYSDGDDAPQLVKGARVRHPSFGAGTVREIAGAGKDVKAVIEFDGVGRKTVVLRYANLQREWE
jgi:DNA helicase-2/ATP-dependent DNA helicase PcrA